MPGLSPAPEPPMTPLWTLEALKRETNPGRGSSLPRNRAASARSRWGLAEWWPEHDDDERRARWGGVGFCLGGFQGLEASLWTGEERSGVERSGAFREICLVLDPWCGVETWRSKSSEEKEMMGR